MKDTSLALLFPDPVGPITLRQCKVSVLTNLEQQHMQKKDTRYHDVWWHYSIPGVEAQWDYIGRAVVVCIPSPLPPGACTGAARVLASSFPYVPHEDFPCKQFQSERSVCSN